MQQKNISVCVLCFLLCLSFTANAFLLAPPFSPLDSSMGIAASVGHFFFADTANYPSSSSTKRRRNKRTKRDKIPKNELKQHAIEKKLVNDAFCAQVLDPLYVEWPVRPSTLHAAALYPPSNPSSTALMPGTHKHLGGAYDPTDGTIYGVPANAKAILVLQPIYDDSNKTVVDYRLSHIPLPKTIADTKMKWLRGIVTGGYLWAIPAWADAVLCVDLDAYWGRRPKSHQGIVQLLPLPDGHARDMIWQWHGAGLNIEKTAIYCIPANAQQVLKVDVVTKQTSLIPIQYDPQRYPNFRLDLGNKWYGGITGDDNAIYGVCYRSCAVLRIDAKTDTATLIGTDYGTAGFNWHGGIKVNGKIYAHPSHAPDTVLVIDTRQDGRCYELPIKRASYDTDGRKNFKWLGGVIGADGNIYCPACDTSSILKINTETDECTTFGFAGNEKNKWQGGILGRDGCIYNIPASGRHILRISTFDKDFKENPIQLLGNLPPHKDKWQGAAQGLDGSLYFIPENGYRVLKVTPPTHQPQLVNGKLPEEDVKIAML